MRYYLLMTIVLLTGCSMNYEVMTRDGYADIDVGMTSQSIEELYGKPYSVYSKGDGTETYEYIEKIMMGTQVVEQRCYYIVVEEGKVVAKHMKIFNPPPFESLYSNDPYPDY